MGFQWWGHRNFPPSMWGYLWIKVVNPHIKLQGMNDGSNNSSCLLQQNHLRGNSEIIIFPIRIVRQGRCTISTAHPPPCLRSCKRESIPRFTGSCSSFLHCVCAARSLRELNTHKHACGNLRSLSWHTSPKVIASVGIFVPDTILCLDNVVATFWLAYISFAIFTVMSDQCCVHRCTINITLWESAEIHV